MTRLILTLALLLPTPAAATVAVRILLGVGDKARRQLERRRHRPRRAHHRHGALAIRRRRRHASRQSLEDVDARHPPLRHCRQSAPRRTFSANGVIVQLEGETEDTVARRRDPAGAFTVRLNEIPLGKVKSGLDGKVVADRLPPYWRITNDPEEQDYPAAATDSSGRRVARLPRVQTQSRSQQPPQPAREVRRT